MAHTVSCIGTHYTIHTYHAYINIIHTYIHTTTNHLIPPTSQLSAAFIASEYQDNNSIHITHTRMNGGKQGRFESHRTAMSGYKRVCGIYDTDIRQFPIFTFVHITPHPNPYIALSTPPLIPYQSALRSANPSTSSTLKIPPYRS